MVLQHLPRRVVVWEGGLVTTSRVSPKRMEGGVSAISYVYLYIWYARCIVVLKALLVVSLQRHTEIRSCRFAPVEI